MSPFSTKLGTNYVPSDVETLEIQNLLVEPVLQLKTLDDEIAKVQNIMDKLVQQRDDLAAYVDAHKALASPVRRLPLDIIQEIFVACLPANRNCVMSNKEAPVLLGRVCSAWRRISLTTPRLWASLHIVEPAHRHAQMLNEKLTQRLEVTKMWLGRSGQCSLSISFDGAPLFLLGLTAFANRFVRELLPFAARWENLALVVPSSTLQELYSLSAADVPMLKRFSFLYHSHQSPGVFSWDRIAILEGGQVSSVEIAGSLFKPAELRLRWNQLTDFSMSGDIRSITDSITLNCEVVLGIISKCPALRRCAVIVDDHRQDDETPIAPLELPFLHTLQVFSAGSADSVIRFLLRCLSLPRLHTFKLRGNASFNGDWEAQDAQIFGQVFANFTQLEYLTIDRAVFVERSLIEVLRRLPPTLRNLRIDNHFWGDPDANILSNLAPSESPLPCPGLENLTMTNCRNMSDDSIVDFVAKRTASSVAPLKRIRIHFQRPLERDVMPALRSFIEAGLDIAIKHAATKAPDISPWRGLPEAPNTQPSVWYE